MNLRFMSFLTLMTASLIADDAAAPSFKKEKIPFIPHVWVSGGFTCLKAQEKGLAFANQTQTLGSTTNFKDSSIVQPHYNWNGGLKIDLGYQPRDWFFFANWTSIENKAYGSQSTSGAAGFYPVLSLSKTLTSANYVTSGTTAWRLNTNLVDIGAAISWRPVTYFILKNQMGLKIASLDQKLRLNYGGGVFSGGIDHLTMINNFIGAGPCVGVSPNILLPYGFSLVGNVTASGLVGHFYIKQKESYLKELLFNRSQAMTRFRWALDAKAALSWQRELLYKALVVSVQAGWEWHEFYGQNQLRSGLGGHSRVDGNLILRGGFLSACLAF